MLCRPREKHVSRGPRGHPVSAEHEISLMAALLKSLLTDAHSEAVPFEERMSLGGVKIVEDHLVNHLI